MTALVDLTASARATYELEDHRLRAPSAKRYSTRYGQHPLRSVAADHGASDVALAKICKKLGVPTPGRSAHQAGSCRHGRCSNGLENPHQLVDLRRLEQTLRPSRGEIREWRLVRCTLHLQLQGRVYDVRGRLVRTLVDEGMPVGRHRVIWEGDDGQGQAVASGVYYVAMDADGQDLRRKVTLLR